MTLPRGFKANAERESDRMRRVMGLRTDDPIDITKLADHLGVRVVSADDLVARDRLEEIERLQAFAFSAATFEIGDRKIIVTNPLRSEGRLASDVAHELSHVLLKHELSEVRQLGGISFRTCKPDEEEQATAFGGTLLLPRALLMRAALSAKGPDQIASENGVTAEMARFRFHTTGVSKQAERRRG